MSIFAKKQIDMELTATNNKRTKSHKSGGKVKTLALSFDPANKAANAIIKMIESCGLFDVLQEENINETSKPTTDANLHNSDEPSAVWCGDIFPDTNEFIGMIKGSRQFRNKDIDLL